MDTPPEAIWSANALLDWAKEKGFQTNKEFVEPAEDENYHEHNDNLASELIDFFEKI